MTGESDFVYGHALYYGNFARVDGAWIERPDPTRAANLDRSLEAGRALPLRELVELETGIYQRGIPDGPSPRELDAQAWAFVRFLRTVDEASPFAALLDDYLERLQATGDPGRAREEAFAAVDWAQLEAAWWYAGWLAGG